MIVRLFLSVLAVVALAEGADGEPTVPPAIEPLPLEVDADASAENLTIEEVPQPWPVVEVVAAVLVLAILFTCWCTAWPCIAIHWVAVTVVTRLALTVVAYVAIPGVGPGTNPHIGWLNLGTWLIAGLLGMLSARRLWRRRTRAT